VTAVAMTLPTRGQTTTAAAAHGSSRRWRLVGGAALLLVSLLVAWLALRLLLAALFDAQAQAFLADWAARDLEPAAVAFTVAERAAQSAIALAPVADGARYDRLGRIYDWQYYQQPLGSAEPAVVASRAKAVEAYETALAQRPLWPHTWTRLAYAKLRLGATDEAFVAALRRAYDLGPWRPHVNRRIAEIGLRGWTALDASARRMALENVRRTAMRGGADLRHLAQVAAATGKTRVVCAVLPEALTRRHRICL